MNDRIRQEQFEASLSKLEDALDLLWFDWPMADADVAHGYCENDHNYYPVIHYSGCSDGLAESLGCVIAKWDDIEKHGLSGCAVEENINRAQQLADVINAARHVLEIYYGMKYEGEAQP